MEWHMLAWDERERHSIPAVLAKFQEHITDVANGVDVDCLSRKCNSQPKGIVLSVGRGAIVTTSLV
jgi:hypothetical protein